MTGSIEYSSFCSVGEENGEGIGLTLSNLFRSECGEDGTILHYAVKVNSAKTSTQTAPPLLAWRTMRGREHMIWGT